MSESTPTTTKRKPPASAWKPGQSGNPAGRPKGSRHKTTLAVESLLQGQADEVAQKAVEMALEGDAAMIRVILDRVAPAPKDRPVSMPLPNLGDASKLPEATARILDAVSQGELTPSEGTALAALVEGHRKSLETADLASRLAAIESKLSGPGRS